VSAARGRVRPGPLQLHHVALRVADLRACEHFYSAVLGMRVLWRPDEDNVYLTNGSDNLALHRLADARASASETLDHIGFALADEGAVDAWHEYLKALAVPIVAPPRTHRDGARSLYCRDPHGNTVQLIHEPRSRAAPGSGFDAPGGDPVSR